MSTASIAQVSEWFKINDAVDRFRMNILIDGVPSAFWEDTNLIGDCRTNGVVFGNESTTLLGVMPCFRCVVPSRVPSTTPLYSSSREMSGFKRIFAAQRADKSLPQSAFIDDHNHEPNNYHFGTSTIVLTDGELVVGDSLHVSAKDVNVQQMLVSRAPLTAEQNEYLITRAYALFELDHRTYSTVYYLNRLLPSAIASYLITRSFFTLRKPTKSELFVASSKVLLCVASVATASWILFKQSTK